MALRVQSGSAFLLLMVWVLSAPAATYHVATNGLHDAANRFDTWGGAATNIHDAVALANSAGGDVLVSNGTYVTGSELVLSNNVILTGVNGPEVTTISRNAAAGNFRVVRLAAAGARLADVTIANGKSGSDGGGASMAAGTVLSNCVVRDCVLTAKVWGNGVYSSGGSIVGCTVTNCDYDQGKGVVVLTGGATIDDSAIVDNTFQTYGALYLMGGSNVARRCRIVGNTTATYASAGGGLVDAGSSMVNCLVAGNRSDLSCAGVRMSGGSLLNCTIVDNTLSVAGTGGLFHVAGGVTNCIVSGNTAYGLASDYGGAMAAVAYSCAPELSAGTSNIVSDPLFVNRANGDYRLSAISPCVDTAITFPAVMTDLDGMSRPLDGNGDAVLRPDMGAYEVADGSSVPLQVGFSGTPLEDVDSLDAVLTPRTVGSNQVIVWHGWDWNGDGTIDQTGGALGTTAHTFGVGHFSVALVVSNAIGDRAAVTNAAMIHVAPRDIYVATSGLHTNSFATWPTASTSVLAAVDEALAGCTIHVSNGMYSVRGEVGLNAGIVLRGEVGPQVTTIVRDASAGNFRVVSLKGVGAGISGVTIAGGNSDLSGAGVCMVAGTTLSNCVVRDCALTRKFVWGNGVYSSGGDIVGCTITNCDYNQGQGIVVLAAGATLEDSIVVDSLFQTYAALYLLGSGNVARRCRVFRNTTGIYGTAGGALVEAGSELANSLIVSNRADANCAGVKLTGGRLLNCTVADNALTVAGAGGVLRTGGGVTNCILYSNTANGSPQNYSGDVAAVSYSCAPELTAEVQGNRTADPMFKEVSEGDYRLKNGSPCINAGTNTPGSAAALDLDGWPRRRGAAVDMGTYEAMGRRGTVIALM